MPETRAQKMSPLETGTFLTSGGPNRKLPRVLLGADKRDTWLRDTAQ